jgi:hypothetical protein
MTVSGGVNKLIAMQWSITRKIPVGRTGSIYGLNLFLIINTFNV